MKVGLDFDDVITDSGTLKNMGAKFLYGVDIPPAELKRNLIADSGLLTLDQYEHLQKQVYATREVGLTMAPIYGALDIISRLQHEGYDLRVVTSRGEVEVEIAKEWMEAKGLDLVLVGVGQGVSKADACKGLDVYMDDDLDKLEPLVGVVRHRYLFSSGPNQNIDIPEGIATRIDSWEHFYDEISGLNGELLR